MGDDSSGSGIMGALGPIGAGLGVVSGLMKLFGSGAQRRAARAIHPVDDPYNINPIAQANYGTAQQAYNGRMAGAQTLQNNLYTNNANFQHNVERNSSDGATNLALAAAGQGQTDQSLSDLQVREAQNKQAQFGNLMNAGGALINEGDKVHEDRVRTFNNMTQQKNQLMNAGAQNQYGGVQDIGQTAMLAGQGAFGQFGKGGGGGGGSSYANMGQVGLMGQGATINPSLYSSVSGYNGMSPFSGNYVSR